MISAAPSLVLGTALLRPISALPYAVLGVVLGVACILIFLRPFPVLGVSLCGTLWIIFAAYLARF